MRKIELQEMTLQEMRDVNGGCCLLWIWKFIHCWKPRPPRPCPPVNPPGGGEN